MRRKRQLRPGDDADPSRQASRRCLARDSSGRATLGIGVIVKLLFATNGSTSSYSNTSVTSATTPPLAGKRSQRSSVRTSTEASRSPTERTSTSLSARLVLETARAEAAWADQAIEEVQQWETTAEPQDRASTLAALEAALAAGAP